MEGCKDRSGNGPGMMCMKHQVYMCEKDMACRDPHIHCKFRSSCPIWFLTKRGGRDIDKSSEALSRVA
ncbi:MAG: hypothetical protein KJ737_08515 [Proteobacteria bacterium]|nr:hypothetical protein [Pseudomonadota bacterium]